MDIQALRRILDRVEAGATTVTDADTLRAIFRPYLDPAPSGPAQEGAHRYESFSQRIGSQATVAINYVRDRYPRGEFQIQTTYRLPDGGVSTDESHRIQFSGQYAPVIRELWDVGFDETLRALQNEPTAVRIAVNCPEMEAAWSETVRTVAVIIGHELDVIVAGTAPDPGKVV